MTPTDAARMITDMKHSGAKQFLVCEHGEAIARALLAAEGRIAALEGALRQIRELTEDYEHNQQLSEVWYVASDALTPEGGGK